MLKSFSGKPRDSLQKLERPGTIRAVVRSASTAAEATAGPATRTASAPCEHRVREQPRTFAILSMHRAYIVIFAMYDPHGIGARGFILGGATNSFGWLELAICVFFWNSAKSSRPCHRNL
ncbi:hypothetical protein QFZ94_002741 [Paraburkholderia sp. JPY465]|uniref:hypothetical protein n=1 Tax=Paraburkholderia sp. JPY465 TaxID=3042285 RepID=UPI003D205D66